MSEDIDYEGDVLKFKQVWDDNKIQDQTQVDPKNLQTIESFKKQNKKNKPQSNRKNSQANKRQNNQKAQTSTKQQKKKQSSTQKIGNKKQMSNMKATIRNPRPNYQQVIQIQTKPNKFYINNLENQKNNIVSSHLYLDRQSSGNTGYNNVYQLKKILEEKDHQLSMLRVTHSRTQDRVRYLEKQIQKKNQIIAQQRQRQRKVIQRNCNLESKEFNFDYGKTQYQNFKNDSRRLLKMLQSTAQYKDFAKLALDDNGVRFLHNVNKQQKSKLDNPNKSGQTIHFCTCNKAFIPQSGFWVPEKIYSFGKNFIRQRNGELSQAQFELLLYDLNKEWRQRQKRIINTYTALKAHQVGKYKRKLQNLSIPKQNRTHSIKRDDHNNEE